MKKQISEKSDRVSRTRLSEKQSELTTFRLSGGANNAINRLIKTNNLKPKEIFDLICPNTFNECFRKVFIMSPGEFCRNEENLKNTGEKLLNFLGRLKKT